MTTYKTIIHPTTYKNTRSYLQALKAGETTGQYLQRQLADQDLSQLSVEAFIEQLVRTKRPQIFAESAVFGDGTDWNLTELSILGDVNMAVPVTVYDNGRHSNPMVHQHPFPATLLFTPGALLRNGRRYTPADWDEVTKDGAIDFDGYYQLYERRLLPPLLYANEQAGSNGTTAFITIPGLGCGQFAGRFQGQLGEHLKNVLKQLLENHGSSLSNVKAIYYDPYQECQNERYEINGISLMVRPLTAPGNSIKSQLCHPTVFQEDDDRFVMCDLFSFVAWDHVSWPGNDFYVGSRATDDGVKAAATNATAVMTGVNGAYDADRYKYQPPTGYRTWDDVIKQKQLQLQVQDNLLVLPEKL